MAKAYLVETLMPKVIEPTQFTTGGITDLVLTFRIAGITTKDEYDKFYANVVEFFNERNGIELADFDLYGIERNYPDYAE